MNILPGDSDYKNFVPGDIVTSLFLWPDDHNRVRNSAICLLFGVCLFVLILCFNLTF